MHPYLRPTFRLGVHALNAFCAAHLFVTYVGHSSPMAGPSMLPTLSYKGERCIGDIFSVRWHNGKNLRRGDLIIFHSPDHASRLVCKRVLGLAGDTVCVDPTGKWADTSEHVLVPNGHVWVMGDNADGSLDSRKYGPVPLGLIHSRVVARIWPLSDFRFFNDEPRQMS